MTDLIASLSTGKGTWAEVARLVRAEDWSHVYFVSTSFAKEKFTCDKPHTFIVIDNNASPWEIRKKVYEALKDKVKLEAAVNLSSGTGNEHMAIISAAFSLGIGIRFVGIKEGKMEEI